MAKLSTYALFALAALIVTLCLFPVVAVVLAALSVPGDTIQGLAATVLPRFTLNTIGLVFLTCTASLIIGVSSAWLVTMTEFPGRRILEICLVLPFAFPAYVLAYAYTHVLDHPGIVQSTLRDVFGWGPRDYWFPEIRSFGGAATMLTVVLYPYVYLLARASFLSQSAAQFLVARTLGQSPFRIFLTVSLPMSRAAAVGGVLLVAMETIADFGTVSFFGVQTFATGIYQSWFSMADRAAAAQLALCLLSFALLLAFLGRITRDAPAATHGRRREMMPRFQLRGVKAAAAIAACSLPVIVGAIIPTIVLITMAHGSEQDLLSRRYQHFIGNSLTLAVIGAAITVAAALALGSLRRSFPGRISNGFFQVARLGYAVPGGVIAVGLLVPMAAFDNRFDQFMTEKFGISTGLLITGSIALLLITYMVRFLAAALSAYESGASAINRNLDHAARVLGKSPVRTALQVHTPLLAPSLLTGALIVFVDVMKELPATLILRPFNFDTLAVQAFRLASDERLTGAAVPSLVIAGIGLLPTILLCRRISRD